MNQIKPTSREPDLRALQREAFSALIEKRLSCTSDLIGGRAASKLVLELVELDVAALTSNPETGEMRLSLLGVATTVPQQTPYALLREWQREVT